MKDKIIQYCRTGKKICLPPSKTLWDIIFRKTTISEVLGNCTSIVVLSEEAWTAVSHHGYSCIKIKSDYSEVSFEHKSW